MTFNIGDIVQLKSGGPDMTVTRVGTSAGEPMIWCAWFEGTKDTYGLFPPQALKVPSEPPDTSKKPSDAADVLTERSEGAGAFTEPQPNVTLEHQPTAVDSASLKPKQEKPAQGAPPAQAGIREEENAKSQDQIASLQALIAGLLKRS